MSLRPAGLEAHLFPSRACSDATPVIAPRHPLPGRGNSPGTHCRGCDPAKTSPVRAHPTKLDKSENLHGCDAIATENCGTRGLWTWLQPIQVGQTCSWIRHIYSSDRLDPPRAESALLDRAVGTTNCCEAGDANRRCSLIRASTHFGWRWAVPAGQKSEGFRRLGVGCAPFEETPPSSSSSLGDVSRCPLMVWRANIGCPALSNRCRLVGIRRRKLVPIYPPGSHRQDWIVEGGIHS